MLDLRGSIPAFVRVTSGECYETAIFDELPIEAGSYYLMDRGYQDFGTFYRMHRQGAFFVTRAKCNVRFTVRESRCVVKARGVRCDQLVNLANREPRRAYPDRLRRIRFFDTEHNLSLVFWTNQLDLPAHTIAELYRKRWRVELFFKWIKYNLRIRSFLGVSRNSIHVQLWSAISVYLLVAIARKQLGLPQTLHQILQVLSVSAFEQVPIAQLFTKNASESKALDKHQMLMFNEI